MKATHPAGELRANGRASLVNHDGVLTATKRIDDGTFELEQISAAHALILSASFALTGARTLTTTGWALAQGICAIFPTNCGYCACSWAAVALVPGGSCGARDGVAASATPPLESVLPNQSVRGEST